MAEKRGKESRIKGNSLGASGFTMGILSIITLGITGVAMSVVGFIFCLIQHIKKPTKLAMAGMILNGIGFIASLLWIFYLAPLINQLISQFPSA